jgi:LPS-assembly protein
MQSLITMAFVSCVLFAPCFATDQLRCPPLAPPSKDESTICAVRQEKEGPIFKLHVRGRIEYGTFTLWADEATYDSDTGDVTLNGHVVLDGSANNEHVEASHGQYNVRTEMGRFYDVTGRIGSRQRPRPFVLTSPVPFEFTGKVVVKTGPDHYVVYDGTITNCELPHPKWQFSMRHANVTAGGNATIYLSTFRIESIPVLYFPFATHPVDHAVRQSGLLMPNLGTSSIKGQILGEGFYWAINRSMDAVVGAELFSKRGWAQHGEFRARPRESAYVDMTYFGVLDRGVGTPRKNQGGEDIRLAAEDRFGHGIRGVANVDYLSSFLFRLAFDPIFSQPLQSEVKSRAFLSNTTNGFSYNALIEHYQSFQSPTPGNVITIVHAPSFDFSSVDRELGHSPFYWAVDTAVEGLSRSEPSPICPSCRFHTAPVVGRFDVNPNVSLPLRFGGWSLRPEVRIRYTLYTQQLVPSSGLGTASSDPINRRALDTSVELRPPTLERLFNHKFLGLKLKHVIEPSVVYRDVTGVNGFSRILRFDERDILSNTNEVEYRVINRLYAKKSAPQSGNCNTPALPSLNPPSGSPPGPPLWDQDGQLQVTRRGDSPEPSRDTCPGAPATARELVSWELAQKYFLDTSFGGALVSGQRNVFTTTVDLTAFAFLTNPRHLSPLVSRLRIQPSSNVDAEWDLDYDFTAGRINASTTSLTYHIGQFGFSGIGLYANFPGQILATNNVIGPSRFNQFRTQVQYGRSDKRGFSGAASFGVDAQSALVQYYVIQSTYNWDCCGINAEYRRIRLGTIRNENEYRFNYTLANIGSFGNLLRKERLY